MRFDSPLHLRSGGLVMLLCAACIAPAQTPVNAPAKAPTPAAVAGQSQSQNPSQDPAQVPTGGLHAIDAVLLRDLIAWAAEHRDRRLPAPGEAPVLQAMPEEQLRQIVCADVAEHACRGLVAAYEPARQRIVYRDSLDMRRPFDRSFIVHELVHWLQHRDGQAHAGADCRAVFAAEREAYAAQNRYLHHYKVGARVGAGLKFMACDPDDKATTTPR
jgi:hypothetical protein